MRKIFYKIPKLNRIVRQRDSLLKNNSDLELKNKNLQNILQNKDGFEDVFLSPWTDAWKKFHIQNHEKVPELMRELKQGMDEESKEVVNILWEKIIYLIPYNKYKKSFLYKKSDFFTEKELMLQKEKADLSRYKFPEDINIEKHVFSTKNGLSFLPQTVQNRIQGGIIIDGGAYIGDSAVMFSEFKPSKICAFEPVDFLHKKLKETVTLNEIDKIVEPVKMGLGESKKDVDIYGINSGASLHINQGSDSQKISVTTIDDFAQEDQTHVDLIKLDVEGSELSVIKGAIETIKKDKPILLISVYHRPEDFFYIKPMIENLDLGYRFMIRKTSPFRVTSETVLIGYID